MRFALSLGYTKKNAVEILRAGGIDGEFDPSDYSKYTAILAEHHLESMTEPPESISEKAERVLRKVGTLHWLFKPVVLRDGEYLVVDEMLDTDTIVYPGITIEESIEIWNISI